jgi:hypothetical protein
MARAASRLVAGLCFLAALAVLAGCATGTAATGRTAGLHAVGQPHEAGTTFVGSVDTMKLSRDRAGSLGSAEVNRVVDLLAGSMSVTDITVDSPMERPSAIQAWANRIHADGKHVWFRLMSTTCDQPHGDLEDGYPNYRPGYLTKLHELIRTHHGFFKPGDILDGDPEAESSCWWASHYGCGVQSACRRCGLTVVKIPCAPVRQFNDFLVTMTKQENIDLAAIGIAGVATNVHATDPGTAMHILTATVVRSMHNLITVDAYPDARTTVPAVAANAWRTDLAEWHQTWLNRGLDVSILVGEWGYCNELNVDNATQQAVIRAETTEAFMSAPSYLVGTNYWVGPGSPGDGGYTEVLRQVNDEWRLRPAASTISSFYAAMYRR